MFEKPYVLIVGDGRDYEVPKLLMKQYDELGFFPSVAVGTLPSVTPRELGDIMTHQGFMSGSIKRGRYAKVAICGTEVSGEIIKVLETVVLPERMRDVEVVDHAPQGSRLAQTIALWKESGKICLT